MTESDLDPVERLLDLCPEAAQWSPGQLLRQSPAPSLSFVAEIEGQIVGMAASRVVADEAELLNLAVAPTYRGRGIGRQLLNEVTVCAQQAGARRIFLEVRASNSTARAFYATLGFSNAGLRPNYYRNPVEDALLLLKGLV